MRIHPLTAALFGLALAGTSQAASALGFTQLWTAPAPKPGFTAEIVDFDAATGSLWVAGVNGVSVVNARTGSFIDFIDTTRYGAINSVAIHGGLAAFAIESTVDRTLPGQVVLFDTRTRALASGINQITVGALPDMVKFTPDGSRLLVANEGTPSNYAGFDPVGSVSIIDLASRTASTAGFAGVPRTGSGIRSPGMDFEPEYIAVNGAGTEAYVSLQEHNAIGVLDLGSGQFTSVVGLGTKDFSLPGNEIDPNDRDGKIELRSAAVKGFYQPDAIAAYDVGGRTFLVTANEGDTREDEGDESRLASSGLGGPADLARLTISTTDSTPGDLFTFGGRSFSIFDTLGNRVYDSGNELEVEAIARGIYSDGRSDNKGVEPEGVELIALGDSVYAFIGLERTTKSAVAIYDITDPTAARFLDMIVSDDDLSPEGLKAFSLDGNHFLAIANEVSNTLTTYRLHAPGNSVPEPATTSMLLAGLGMLGFMARRRARG